MKLLNKIVLTGASVLLLAGCQSDLEFLSEQPKSILTIENAYNSSTQVLSTLLSAYNEYEGFFFASGMGAGVSTTKNLGTDVLDANNQLAHQSNFTATWATDAGFVKDLWDQYYRMISFCNLALSQMDNVEWNDPSEKTREIAEANFLRGVAYLELGVIYGGVPLVTEFSETPKFDYVRASRKETLEYAIDNLLAGYESLPETIAMGQPGRASKSAAALYLSKAFLALGVEADNESYYGGKTCWKNAQDFASEVIQKHPIMTNRFGVRLPSAQGSNNGIPNAFPEGNVFSDLFVSANMPSPSNTEAIWVMMSAPDYATFAANGTVGWIGVDGGGGRNSSLGYSPAVQDMNWADEYKEAGAGAGPWKVVSSKYGGMTNPAIHGGLGWGLFPTTEFVATELWDAAHNLDSQDYRYTEGVTVRTRYLICDETHSLYETYGGWEHITKNDENTCSKLFPIWYKETPLDGWDYDPADPGMFGSVAYCYRNKYAARSGEAYLLLAEAYFRDGNNGKALEALNTLRARSNAQPFNTIDINIILDERAREMHLEESRWFTLLRMKPEEWKPRIYNYGMYSARGGAKVFPQIRRWSEFTGNISFNYWPIPQAYIDLNTGSELAQNEGWK